MLIDGVDLAMVDLAWLRRQIGVVLQENVLFNRSIRENIALADPALPMERVIEAAKLAGAHDFILELPEGYDTMVGERGSSLSGGQRQRIAIARALITDPRILIFDEATSALDYESERIIQQNMRAIAAGRTVFIIAHRLSTVRQADRIIAIERGRIVEDGTHDELISATAATPSCITYRRASMTSASKKIVPFPESGAATPRGRRSLSCPPRSRSPNAAVARRAGDRGHHHRGVLHRPAVGVVGTVDIVATAAGKIVPGGRTKLIQPFETGVVRAIHVRDGQGVKAGDVLIELDPTMIGADVGAREERPMAARLEVARLRAALRGSARQLPAAERASPRRSRCSASFWSASGPSRTPNSPRSGASSARRRPSGLPPWPPSPSSRRRFRCCRSRSRSARCSRQGLASKVIYLTEMQELVGLQKDLWCRRAGWRSRCGRRSAEGNAGEDRAEYRRTALRRTGQSRAEGGEPRPGRHQGGAADQAAAADRAGRRRGAAARRPHHRRRGDAGPGAGGGRAGESRLEIEAMVSNRDIGFIHAGQQAEIKVDTFNFTRYGLFTARCSPFEGRGGAREAKTGRPTGPQAAGRRQRAEGSGAGIRRARLAQPQHMQVEDKIVKLRPAWRSPSRSRPARAGSQLPAVAAGKIRSRIPA